MNRKNSADQQSADRLNVQVAVRVRPLNNDETEQRATNVVKLDEKGQKVTCKSKTYGPFDHVFGAATSQLTIFDKLIRPHVDRVLAGFNCTVFAYGQTGTGKTFTMEGGSENAAPGDPSLGMTPRAVETLFQQLEHMGAEEFSVRVSYLELYNEELFDLLGANTDDRERLRIFEDPSRKGAVVVSGAEEVPVRCRNEVYGLLKRGADRKIMASTLMNRNSSRSHTIFTVTVVVRENSTTGDELVKTGKLNLVDLAGSEHIGRSGAEGRRAKEAGGVIFQCSNRANMVPGSINQSLLTLGRVITALTTSSVHVPYRESKLTRILQDSLGGSTITSIIATCSPASINFEETASTLDYAMRAKNIKNHPECNQKISRKAILKEYNNEIEKLRRDLRAAREKSGIHVSQETYDGMEREIEEKKARVDELEEQLDCMLTKMMRFAEDSISMRDQYQKVFELQMKMRSKLELRVQELDDTQQTLNDKQQQLNAYTNVAKELHRKATTTLAALQQTREVLSAQCESIEQWWAREKDLCSVIQLNAVAFDKVLAQTKDCTQSCMATGRDIRAAIASTEASLDGQMEAAVASLSADINVVKANQTKVLELVDQQKQTMVTILENLLQKEKSSLESCRTDIEATLANLKSQINEANTVTTDAVSSILSTQTSLLESVEATRNEVLTLVEKDRNHVKTHAEESSRLAQEFDTKRNEFQTEMAALMEKMSAAMSQQQQYENTFVSRCADLNSSNTIKRSDFLENITKHFESMKSTVASRTEDCTTSTNNVEKSMQSLTGALTDGIRSISARMTSATTSFDSLYQETSNQWTSTCDAHFSAIDEETKVATEAAERARLTMTDAADDARNSGQQLVEQAGASLEKLATSYAKVEEMLANVDENWAKENKELSVPEKRHLELDTDCCRSPVKKLRKMVERELPEASLTVRTRESMLDTSNYGVLSPSAFKEKYKHELNEIQEVFTEDEENQAPVS